MYEMCQLGFLERQKQPLGNSGDLFVERMRPKLRKKETKKTKRKLC